MHIYFITLLMFVIITSLNSLCENFVPMLTVHISILALSGFSCFSTVVVTIGLTVCVTERKFGSRDFSVCFVVSGFSANSLSTDTAVSDRMVDC